MQEPSILDYLLSLVKGKPLKIPGQDQASKPGEGENLPAQGLPPQPTDLPGTAPAFQEFAQGGESVPTPRSEMPVFQGEPKEPVIVAPPQPGWSAVGKEMLRDGFNYFRGHRNRLIGVALVLILTLSVLSTLPNLPRTESHLGVFLMWLAAIGLYFWVFWERESESKPGQEVIKDTRETRLSYLLLAGIILAGFLLRIWHVGSIPFTLSGDEASFGAESLKILAGEIRDPFITGHLSQPTMSFYPGALTQKLLGVSTFAIRLPWVIVGTLSVLATYLLAQRLYGNAVGLASAAAVAVYHYHIHYSRLNLNNIADPFFVSMSLYWLYRAVETRSKIAWAWVGAFAGLALYFYTGARLVHVILVSVFLYWLIYERRRYTRQTLAGIVVMLGAFLVVSAPILQFANQHPNDFNGRINQVGIIQSGWLEREVVITGKPMQDILVDQFRRAALAFHYYPDRSSFYDLRQPLLDPWSGALLLFALGFGTLFMLLPGGDGKWFPVVAWFWGGIILGGMMTITPPASQRLITVAVPVCIMLVLGLRELGLMAQKAFGKFPVHVLYVLGVIAFGAVSLKTYFVDYTSRQVFGGTHAELATALAPMLNEMKATHRILFVGAPFVYWGFPTFPYLVQNADAQDILEPLSGPPPREIIPPGKGAIFIILPAREQELAFIQQAFPNGETRLVETKSELQTRALLYIVPPGGN